MTESINHQEHLQQLVQQEQSLVNEVESKKNLLFKVRGAIEYLTEIGVKLPEPEATTEETSPETPETQVVE